MSENDDPTHYDVRWRRPEYPDEILECYGLTAEVLIFRIRCVIRLCGSVELLALTSSGEHVKLLEQEKR
jgi:hypothetical protein